MIGDILQPTHLLFVLIVALLVLGPKRLPEVGRSLGRGIRDFRNAISGDDMHNEVITPEATATSTPTDSSTTPAETTTAPAAEPTGDLAAQPATTATAPAERHEQSAA